MEDTIGNWRSGVVRSAIAAVALAAFSIGTAWAQMQPTPPRGPNDGGGPYQTLIIWGANIIDGAGSPAFGPMNITVKNDIIVAIERADVTKRPDAERVIDARGGYVTPGFIDVHDHLVGAKVDNDASYVYKLWLGHGITTVKGVPFGDDHAWALEQSKLSDANRIVAPRLVVCSGGLGTGGKGDFNTPEQARAWVQQVNKLGINCVGELFSMYPDIEAAVLQTADQSHMWTQSHLSQNHVSRMTAADAVNMGLDEVTHFYGIFESMLTGHSVQDFPVDYNYNNEYDRFSQVSRLWKQSAAPGSKPWNDLIQLFLAHNTVLSPTMTIYLASRDPMAARNADWMSQYVLPSLWAYFEPNPRNHGSYFYHWNSADEAEWHHFYAKWQQFIKDYNDAGGRIAVGEDTAFIYQVHGFGYIQELKLLQEAGLTPLEIIRAATLNGAETIFMPRKPWGKPIQYGLVREGLKADLLVFNQNPMTDFNLLYGTGALRLDEKTGKAERVKALQYTISRGVVYDSQKLLAEVRDMVIAAKRKAPNVDMPHIPLAGSSTSD